MNRQTPYGDASVNRYAASQSHVSAQRMQQNAQTPQFPFRADGRQQWNTNTNPQIELNPMSPHSYSQGGHKGNMKIQSQERMGNQKFNNYENQGNKETRMQPHEQEMDIGYEDNNSYTPSQLSFEGLEQRFQDEIMKLIKEQSNAEDAENARHKERILEVNTRYQENLCSLRAQHATRAGEFVRKESETRFHHYQEAANAMAERGPPGGMGREARRQYEYGGIQDESSYREHQHPQYREREPMTSQGYESRVPYPHGRVYNNSGAHY